MWNLLIHLSFIISSTAVLLFSNTLLSPNLILKIIFHWSSLSSQTTPTPSLISLSWGPFPVLELGFFSFLTRATRRFTLLLLYKKSWTSLAVQWLRICASLQGHKFDPGQRRSCTMPCGQKILLFCFTITFLLWYSQLLTFIYRE